MPKTHILLLIIIRFIAVFSIIALLSPDNTTSKSEDVSGSGHVYSDRDLACAVISIFIVEIPFIFIEALLTKSVLYTTDSQKTRQWLLVRKTISYIFIYLFFLGIIVLGTMNTLWISLKVQEESKEVNFIHNFMISQIFDYFCYEIFIITTKTIIFFLLIKDDSITWWKKGMIISITALPWLFTILG